MNAKQLAERVKSLRNKKLKEQDNITPDKIRKQERLKIDIGSGKHDPTSPNQSHIGEGREVSGQQSSIGGRHSPRKRLDITSLGNVRERSAAQRAGNQRRTASTYAEEATQIAIKKVKDKKGEEARGATSTGQKADTLDFTPTKPELTSNH